MPYIKKKERCGFFDKVERPGKLNYLITMAVHEYILQKGLSYTTLNEAIGVLECAKLELYRMVAAPYEDKKKRENGAISILDSKTLEDVR